MNTFVLDADGAVKLARAEVLVVLCSFASCLLSRQVFEEVLKGKEKMFEDAFIVEELEKKGKIKVLDVDASRLEGLGVGESSALALLRKVEAEAIISDDRRFLRVLESEGIPFLIPTSVIVMLALSKKISVVEAGRSLEAIRRLVRDDDYRLAKEMIGE